MADATVRMDPVHRIPARPAAGRGITMVELLITMAVMCSIIAAVVPLFTFLSRGFSSQEVGAVLPVATQEAVNKIQSRLVESRRIFENTTVGNGFRGRIPALSASPVGWSRLPIIGQTMSMSASTGVFVAANIGNSLFFASTFRPVSLTLPGYPTPVRIDTFIFNYYYLHENPNVTVQGKSSLELWEWHSAPYADYLKLSSMPVAKTTTTVAALWAQNVRLAWDSSVDVPNQAFYVTTSTGGMGLQIAHQIQPTSIPSMKPEKMVQVIQGAASAGFRYGVSRNSTQQRFVVPAFATISGEFPAGFEVMAVGPGSSRQVFLRLVLAAQGNFKGVRTFKNDLSLSLRDIY